MSRHRNKKGILDVRIILKDDLADFLRSDSEKEHRTLAEHVRYIIAQYKSNYVR